MKDIPRGHYIALEYQKCEKRADNERAKMHGKCKYIDTIRLNISDTKELSKALARVVDLSDNSYLTEDDLIKLVEYIDTPLEVDVNCYEYYLVVVMEDWLQEQSDNESREKIKKWKETIPDPKEVFALLVFDKDDEDSEVYEMPLYGIDVSEVRDFFKVPESNRFDVKCRLDQKMYDFISDRIDCNNIKMNKYEYMPIIRYNNYEQLDDVIIIPCHIKER